MEELLIALIQFLFEFACSVLAEFPFDWSTRNRRTPEPDSIAFRCLLWFLAASLLAWLSLLVFSHTLIRWPQLRILNLLLAPLTSAYLSYWLTSRRARQNPNLVPRNHFWQAFWFTLGWVLVRFAYAEHS